MANCNVLECGLDGEMQAWGTYAFSVLPSEPYTHDDIEYGVMTVKYAGEVLLQLDMTQAVLDFDTGAIVWGLTQEQTGLMPVGQRVTVYFDLVAYDGERSEIDPLVVKITESGVDGTIPISEGENE